MKKYVMLLMMFLLIGVVYGEEKPYIVDDQGRIDKKTYNGFRRFHATCHVCHGKDALGSTIAPSLVDSLTRLSYEEFKTTVTEGKTTTTAGQIKVMPTFKENKDIMKYLDDIYAFLKARSDGVLKPGRPKKF